MLGKEKRTKENIEIVKGHFLERPKCSTTRASLELTIPRTTLRRILKIDLGLKPYKIQLNQPLKPENCEARFDFANEMIELIENNSIDINRIWFTDEAHFDLNGYVNKQNWRHWALENPHLSVAKPIHPERVTVWSAISSIGIIGPVFIDSTINSKKYIEILEESMIPILHGIGKINNSWFMQDGARPHRTIDTFKVLEEHFGRKIIALDTKKFTGNGIEWPAYSPDLNPCDFFLWGYLKDNVYKQSPQTISDLKSLIEIEISKISNTTFGRISNEVVNRLRNLICTKGKHFEHLIH